MDLLERISRHDGADCATTTSSTRCANGWLSCPWGQAGTTGSIGVYGMDRRFGFLLNEVLTGFRRNVTMTIAMI